MPYNSPPNSSSPVFAPMASYMKVDLMAQANGAVWIAHDKPLPDIVKWADFDAASGTVTLAMESGKTQELGVKAPPAMAEILRECVQVSVMLMEKTNISDFTIVPLNVNVGV